jgi:hypothetical protein
MVPACLNADRPWNQAEARHWQTVPQDVIGIGVGRNFLGPTQLEPAFGDVVMEGR